MELLILAIQAENQISIERKIVTMLNDGTGFLAVFS